jgi:hypothetical protein
MKFMVSWTRASAELGEFLRQHRSAVLAIGGLLPRSSPTGHEM